MKGLFHPSYPLSVPKAFGVTFSIVPDNLPVSTPTTRKKNFKWNHHVAFLKLGSQRLRGELEYNMFITSDEGGNWGGGGGEAAGDHTQDGWGRPTFSLWLTLRSPNWARKGPSLPSVAANTQGWKRNRSCPGKVWTCRPQGSNKPMRIWESTLQWVCLSEPKCQPGALANLCSLGYQGKWGRSPLLLSLLRNQ